MALEQTSTTQVDDVICDVVEEIADIEDVDPLELSPPLFDVVDTDALCQIIATTPDDSSMEVEVVFPYNGHEVTVRSDGDVSVEA